MKLHFLRALIALGLLLAAFNYMPQANAQEVEGELEFAGEPSEPTAEPTAISDSFQE